MEKENDIALRELADALKAERRNLLRYAACRLGSREDAEDALQDVFLRLHARLSAPDGLQIRDLRSYLFRTLSNVCAKGLSHAGRMPTVPLDPTMRLADATYDGLDEADCVRIARLLAEIPEEQAEVIRLRIYADNSFAEVAGILALPVPTVKSRFRSGLEKLRKAMHRKHETNSFNL